MTDDIAPLQDHLLIKLLTKKTMPRRRHANESRIVNLGQHAMKPEGYFFLDKLDFKRFSWHLIRFRNQ